MVHYPGTAEDPDPMFRLPILRWIDSPALRRGWFLVAVVLLCAQFATATHFHAAGNDPAEHLPGACQLCVAQALPASPPATGWSLPTQDRQESLAPATATRAPTHRRLTWNRQAARAPPVPRFR